MTRIGFLDAKAGAFSAEETAAWAFLSHEKRLASKRVRFDRIPGVDALRRSYDILWWHCDSEHFPDAVRDEKVTRVLRAYVERGGSLLLSLTAAAYVCDLGFESNRPSLMTAGEWKEESWAKDYPDIRGFASYQGHPLFAGMTGGPYTWAPTAGRPFAAAVYHDTLPAQGRVVAVERQYIKVIPSRRIVAEYSAGRGRILCIGTYLFFREESHRVRAHLEQITRNAFSTLTSKRRTERATYWTFERSVPREALRSSRPIPHRSERSAQHLDVEYSGPSILRQLAPDAPGEAFNVGGRRCVILGNERKGIEEVWTHPVRTLRRLRFQFSVGEGAPVPAESLHPSVTLRPECVERTFKIAGATIVETTLADPVQPGGIVRFAVDSLDRVRISMTGESDLRLMWPLDEHATGSLTYSWDDGLNAAVIASTSGEFASIVGCSRPPVSRFIGPWSTVELQGFSFAGGEKSDRSVAFGAAFDCHPSDPPLVIAIAGSGTSEREAELTYRSLLRSPQKSMQAASEAARTLFQHSTTLTSPDRRFNDDLLWAVHSMDRFFLETPGLGSSYVAGLGTVEKGWNGGHEISGRPGYTWYFGRDSVWTAFAALASGAFDRVRGVLTFLGQHQDVTGKILHELTTSGFAHFDAADSTPLYLILFGRYLRATGHRSFARREFSRLQKAVEFCASTDTDGDGLIENTNVGHGWVEGGGLFPVHSEHYLASCWAEALKESAFVAQHCGSVLLARRWRAEAARVADRVDADFWNTRTSFFNFAKRADGSYSEEKTILPAVGLSFGIGSSDKAASCLRVIASEDFTSDWGVRIIGRSNPMFNPTGYHYGSVWPLFTGWAALAEFKHHRPLQGYLHAVSTARTSNVFSAGHVEEVFRGDILQPSGVCSHQAWSESMVVQPLMEGMLGLEPDGLSHRLKLSPWFPPDWIALRIERIRVGSAGVTVHFHRSGNATLADFTLEGWTPVEISIALRFPLGTTLDRVELGRKSLSVGKTLSRYEDAPVISFRLASRMSVVYHHEGGCGIVPPLSELKSGQASSGVRVIEERCDHGYYEVELEGPGGTKSELSLVHAPDGRGIEGVVEEHRWESGSRVVVLFPEGPGWSRVVVRVY